MTTKAQSHEVNLLFLSPSSLLTFPNQPPLCSLLEKEGKAWFVGSDRLAHLLTVYPTRPFSGAGGSPACPTKRKRSRVSCLRSPFSGSPVSFSPFSFFQLRVLKMKTGCLLIPLGHCKKLCFSEQSAHERHAGWRLILSEAAGKNNTRMARQIG